MKKDIIPTYPRVDKLNDAERAQFLGQFLGAMYVIGYGYKLTVTCINQEIQSEE